MRGGTIKPSIPVYEGDDDVFDVDVLMELSAGAQKRVQGLEVKLVWENLHRGEKGKKTVSRREREVTI